MSLARGRMRACSQSSASAQRSWMERSVSLFHSIWLTDRAPTWLMVHTRPWGGKGNDRGRSRVCTCTRAKMARRDPKYWKEPRLTKGKESGGKLAGQILIPASKHPTLRLGRKSRDLTSRRVQQSSTKRESRSKSAPTAASRASRWALFLPAWTNSRTQEDRNANCNHDKGTSEDTCL